jgi:membrane protease YdiL (CAAX protease family)
MARQVVPDPLVVTETPWLRRQPFAVYVAFAYGISWSLWAVAYLTGSSVPFLLGVFGPMAAAAIVTVRTGGSLRAWIAPLWHWRVPLRWWAYALGLPALLYAVVSLALRVLGDPIDWSLALDRAPDYAGTFLFVLVLGGAMEEPGWRGFGLDTLQRSHSPLVATLLLGLAWGCWHIPVYGPLGFVVPTVLAFFYTVLWNRTRSLLLCVLLHASFTPAQDHLILMARDRAYTHALDTPDWVIFGVYVLAAALLVLITRGRLGERESTERSC